MADIESDIAEILVEIEDGEFVYDPQRIYLVLSRAAGKINSQACELERSSKTISDMSWERDGGDRMGGSFSSWEINRRGDEWS
jgi:hypothetical protein